MSANYKSARVKGWRRVIASPVTILLLSFTAVFIAKAVWGLWSKYELAKGVRETSEERLEALEAQKTELEAELKRLTTPEGVEAEARANLGVVAPGEHVLNIIEE